MVSETCTGPAENIKVCSSREKVEDSFCGIQSPTISLHTLAQPPPILQVVIENSQGVGMNRDEADGEKGL